MSTATKLQRGDMVQVFISNRADFIRYARVLRVYDDEVLVEYENREQEIVPLRWL